MKETNRIKFSPPICCRSTSSPFSSPICSSPLNLPNVDLLHFTLSSLSLRENSYLKRKKKGSLSLSLSSTPNPSPPFSSLSLSSSLKTPLKSSTSILFASLFNFSQNPSSIPIYNDSDAKSKPRQQLIKKNTITEESTPDFGIGEEDDGEDLGDFVRGESDYDDAFFPVTLFLMGSCIYRKPFVANIVDCFYDLEETYDEFFYQNRGEENDAQYSPISSSTSEVHGHDGPPERNERLFYKLLIDNVEELLPIVCTATVGEACQKYESIFKHPQGLYISLKEKGKILGVLKNWPERSIQVIVITDGDRILGIGDLGSQGMGIPIGKLALYTALGGVRPSVCLRITIDVGTNNEQLLKDEFYVGLRQRRATGKEYANLLHEFMAVKQNYGEKVLVQFEDFTNHNAFELLEEYGSTHLVFDDDIQARNATGSIAPTIAVGLGALTHTLGTLIPVIGASGFVIAAAAIAIRTVVGSFK